LALVVQLSPATVTRVFAKGAPASLATNLIRCEVSRGKRLGSALSEIPGRSWVWKKPEFPTCCECASTSTTLGWASACTVAMPTVSLGTRMLTLLPHRVTAGLERRALIRRLRTHTTQIRPLGSAATATSPIAVPAATVLNPVPPILQSRTVLGDG
jgi:hypothetical protein